MLYYYLILKFKSLGNYRVQVKTVPAAGFRYLFCHHLILPSEENKFPQSPCCNVLTDFKRKYDLRSYSSKDMETEVLSQLRLDQMDRLIAQLAIFLLALSITAAVGGDASRIAGH